MKFVKALLVAVFACGTLVAADQPDNKRCGCQKPQAAKPAAVKPAVVVKEQKPKA